jgi:hypothetical protein
MPAKLHLAEDAFTLQLFLQRSQCLVDVVIANKYLHETFPSLNRGASEVDQFISPIFRHKSSATWPFNLKPGSNSLIFVEFVLLGFDLGANCTLERL